MFPFDDVIMRCFFVIYISPFTFSDGVIAYFGYSQRSTSWLKKICWVVGPMRTTSGYILCLVLIVNFRWLPWPSQILIFLVRLNQVNEKNPSFQNFHCTILIYQNTERNSMWCYIKFHTKTLVGHRSKLMRLLANERAEWTWQYV